MQNLNKYIQSGLAKEYGLVGRYQEKYVCNVHDLFDIASFLWQEDGQNYKAKGTRLKLHPFFRLLYYTAARLEAIVKSSSWKGPDESLTYRVGKGMLLIV